MYTSMYHMVPHLLRHRDFLITLYYHNSIRYYGAFIKMRQTISTPRHIASHQFTTAKVAGRRGRVSTGCYSEHPTRFDGCGMTRKLGVPSAINRVKCERRTSRDSPSEGLIKLVVGRHGLGTAVRQLLQPFRHHTPVQA
jgi:hypothetical protein